ARRGRVDGEGGERGQVAPRQGAPLGFLRRRRGLLLDEAGEAAQAEPLLEQVGDRVAGARRLVAPPQGPSARSRPSLRAAPPPRAFRPTSPRRRVLPPPSAAPAAALRGRAQPLTWAATVSRAFCRASSTAVRGLSTTFTSGWMPPVRARFSPFGVKYSPTV